MNVRIEKDGRVSKFEIAKPSENATVNESVAAVAKQVSQVDPPPAGLIKGDHYDVKINFELNTEQGGAKLMTIFDCAKNRGRLYKSERVVGENFKIFRLALQASREFLRNFVAPRRGLGQSSNVTFICSWIVKAREPDENIFAFPHWQRGKSVLAMLGHEIRQDRCA